MNKALIVGINQYPNDNSLNGCCNDATGIANMLQKHEDGSPNFDVKLQHDTPTKGELNQMLRELFDSGKGDTALFYFSGHGTVVNQNGYLVTPDWKDGDEGIRLLDLLEMANKATNYHNRVIVLDCCHAGWIRENSSSSCNAPNIAPGVTLLAACRKEQYSIEEDDAGLFTSLLISGLQGQAADLCGNVTPAGLYAFVDKYLGSWDQRPVFATNIQTSVILRKTKPPISLEVLRRISQYFAGNQKLYQLDPSYEFTNDPNNNHELVEPYAIPEHVKILKDLQKMVSIGLVKPVDEEHMYFAAMHSKQCQLTPIGEYFRNLVNNGRI